MSTIFDSCIITRNAFVDAVVPSAVNSVAAVESFKSLVKPTPVDSTSTTTTIASTSDACIICETENCEHVLSCSHRVCKDCVTQHCRVAIVDERKHEITCPARKCSAVVDYDTIRKSVSDETLIAKLDALICAAALETELRFACSNSLRVVPLTELCCRNTKNGIRCATCKTLCEKNTSNNTFYCFSCDSTFCAKCHELEHFDDSDCGAAQIEEAMKELGVEFTRCPQCGVTIEKTDGCDCVRCFSCKRKFCFRCGIFDRDIVDYDEHRATCDNFSAFNENEQSDREDD